MCLKCITLEFGSISPTVFLNYQAPFVLPRNQQLTKYNIDFIFMNQNMDPNIPFLIISFPSSKLTLPIIPQIQEDFEHT